MQNLSDEFEEKLQLVACEEAFVIKFTNRRLLLDACREGYLAIGRFALLGEEKLFEES